MSFLLFIRHSIGQNFIKDIKNIHCVYYKNNVQYGQNIPLFLNKSVYKVGDYGYNFPIVNKIYNKYGVSFIDFLLDIYVHYK